MGYRPDKQQRRDWARWLARHRERLLLTGVPEEVFSDDFRWIRLLEEGGDDHASGWCVEMMAAEDAQQLHSFVREHYGDADYRGLLRRLEERSRIARSRSPLLPILRYRESPK